MKKLISAILICCMMLPMILASAAEEATVPPTIEEILNSYHNQAFEAQSAEENGGASTYARGSSSQTLEQETVDALTDAGYEAYNVTGENYEALENALNTDFAAMGLDPASSYVVVISGEDPAAQSNPNARVLPPANDDFDGDDGGGGSSFLYVQDGITYTMRYVTVASDASADLRKSTLYTLQEINEMAVFAGCALEALANLAIEYTEEKIETSIPLLAEIAFLADWMKARDPEVYIALGDNMLTIHATSVWTLSYIQVWDATQKSWVTAQSSCYSVSRLTAAGYLYNKNIKDYEWVATEEIVLTTYSGYYNHSARRKEVAVEGFTKKYPLHDSTGDICFSFYSITGTDLLPNGEPLFTHKQPKASTIDYFGSTQS